MKNFLRKLVKSKKQVPNVEHKVTTLTSTRYMPPEDEGFQYVYYNHIKSSICEAVKELITFEERYDEETGKLVIKGKIDIIYVEDIH